jgi:hypothetical protein
MSDGMKGTMPKIAVTTLALCLACFASGCSDIAPSREGARVIHPTSFVCFFPAPPSVQAQLKPQPIPPGKPLEDLCPPGCTSAASAEKTQESCANVLFFYDSVPSVADIPPPLGLDSAAKPQPDVNRSSL